MIAECLFVDAVYDGKVIHRLEEDLGKLSDIRRGTKKEHPDRRLHDFSHIAAGSFNNRAKILEGLFCLFLDTTGHDPSSGRIKRYVP